MDKWRQAEIQQEIDKLNLAIARIREEFDALGKRLVTLMERLEKEPDGLLDKFEDS